MKMTLHLTLDGLVGALRMKAHALSDGLDGKHRPRPPRPAGSAPKPNVKDQPRQRGEGDDFSGR